MTTITLLISQFSLSHSPRPPQLPSENPVYSISPVTRLPLRIKWWQACLVALLLTLATFGASAANPKRVLILNPFQRDVEPLSTIVSEFRTMLTRDLGEPVDIHDLPLDLARFWGQEGEASLVAFLEGRIKNHPVDLVVTVGPAGAEFAARHRERLFPDTPLLMNIASPRLVPPGILGTNVAIVAHRVNLPGMVEDILRLQPETTNIALVFGSSAIEQFWAEEFRRESQPFTNRVEFTWLNGLSLEQTLKRCAVLPPRSFILHFLFVADADGVACEKNEALLRLHQTANAPLFGYFSSEFGLGPIGGRLFRSSEFAALGALTAIRILRGENPASMPPQVLEAEAPVYDWRELRRWGISEANLPTGSIIKFRQSTFWEQYRWLVIGTGLFCLLQTALIAGLWMNRVKRMQGETEVKIVTEISSKFVNLPADEVDQAIIDALEQICRVLDLDLIALWQYPGEATGDLIATHAYRLQGGPIPDVPLREENFPWARNEVNAGRMIRQANIDKLPAEAAKDRESLREMGIRSSLCIPLSVGGQQPVGVLAFNSIRRQQTWPQPMVKRLELVAQIFGNALARKRADQALRENEQRMTLAADAAHFGVWVYNLAPNQVWGSERWQRLFGFVTGQDIGIEAVLERIHPDDRETVEREVRQALANRSDYVGEFRAVLPDGTLRWIASRGRGFPDDNGTPLRMVGAAIDITERKRAETDAHELRNSLAHAGRVSLLGQLASALAHELSQPLGAILRNTEAAEILLREHSPDLEEIRAIVTDIHADDQRASQVIDHLRSLLKRRSLDRQPVDLQAVIA